MSPDNIWTIKVIFLCLSGLFGTLAAVLGFCEVAQNEKYDDTKAWFGAKWQSINHSRWLTLPDRVIKWFVEASKMDWIEALGDAELAFFTLITVSVRLVAPTFLFFACLSYWGVYLAIVIATFSIPLLAGRRPFIIAFLGQKLWYLYSVLSFIVIFVGTVIVWTYMLLRLSVYFAAPIMIILFPIYWVVTLFPLVILVDPWLSADSNIKKRLMLFMLGVTVGITVTFMALLIGHVADPVAYVPQTFQMLASNVLFDGLTMVVTFTILSWAVERGWLFSIPLAVFLDLVAAALLACCSLYFALVGTEHALSVRELLWVLVAHSPDGSRVELSPYFWTMHTTFLPTFAYLALILVTWFAKLLLTPIRWFFGKGHEHKSPLKLTAALCASIAAIIYLFSLGAGSAYERAKEKAAVTAPTAVVK